MKISRLTVSKVRSCEGSDGVAWSCDILLDGRKVGSATNSGSGGDTDIYISDKPAEKEIAALIAALPEEQATPDMADWEKSIYPRKLGLGDVLAELCDDYDNEKRLRRACKTKTLVRYEGEPEGEWHVFKVVYDKCKRAGLTAYVEKQGHKIAEILNDRFTQATT